MSATYFHPLVYALFAAGFIWLMTCLGAGTVFFLREVSAPAQRGIFGLTAGIMLAACYWSLLEPAIAMAQQRHGPAWLTAAAGVSTGVAFLMAIDALSRRKSRRQPSAASLLLLSVTLHNVPEGLAVGVAFGVLSEASSPAAFAAAFSVALGIGIQNIPEGTAVSLPMRKSGYSTKKSFFLGVLSGGVEPLAALTGATLVVLTDAVLPFALAFSAGAMLYVVWQEMLPQATGRPGLLWTAVGFVLMMSLDVALG